MAMQILSLSCRSPIQAIGFFVECFSLIGQGNKMQFSCSIGSAVWITCRFSLSFQTECSQTEPGTNGSWLPGIRKTGFPKDFKISPVFLTSERSTALSSNMSPAKRIISALFSLATWMTRWAAFSRALRRRSAALLPRDSAFIPICQSAVCRNFIASPF